MESLIIDIVKYCLLNAIFAFLGFITFLLANSLTVSLIGLLIIGYNIFKIYTTCLQEA